MISFDKFAFLKKMKDSGVLSESGMHIFILTGIIMFGLTLAAYVMQYIQVEDVYEDEGDKIFRIQEKRVEYLSLAIIIIHSAVGVFVAVDTWQFSGKSIFLQSLIIGGGSFNTFLQTLILTVAYTFDSHYFFAYALSALAFACLANAMMIALLFAMFHTGLEAGKTPTASSLNSNIGKLAF